MANDITALLALLDLIVDGVKDGIQAVKNGSNVVADAPMLMQLIQDAGPAFSNIKAVPGELAALSAEDASAVVAHVAAKLALADAHAQLIVEASLKAAAAVYALFKAIEAPAPVAPAAS